MRRTLVALVIALIVAASIVFILHPRPQARKESVTAAKKGPQLLTVFIPCGLARPFNELREVWERKHPDVKLYYVYDSAVDLVRKAKKGKRGDVFISPGEVELAELERDGIVDPSGKRVFGYVPLVLAVPADNPAGIRSLEDLATAKLRTFGLPDPRLNSLGYHTEEALKRLGLWEKVRPKVVETEYNIRTYMFLASKKVDAAVIYTACPLRSNPEKLPPKEVKVVAKLPYKPLPFIAAPFAKGNKRLAGEYISLLLSDEGQAIFGRYGVLPPKPRKAARKPVLIEVFYPLNERHKPIVRAVREVASKFPGRVKVKFFDIRSGKGMEEFMRRGLNCGTIMVDGRSEFKIGGREVVLKGPFEAVWTKGDLEEVVKRAVEGRL